MKHSAREKTDRAALARELVPLILAEVAKLVAKAAEPSCYTSRRGEGPDGVPDRVWKGIASKIGRRPYPGARWLVVDRATYDRWLASQMANAAPAIVPAANDAKPWHPSQEMAALGLRGAR